MLLHCRLAKIYNVSARSILEKSHLDTLKFTLILTSIYSDEICREKILYASEACGQIDIDNTATDAGGVFD